MNYIEYMKSGGASDSTYYKEIPLEKKWGSESTLTLKRNNWTKELLNTYKLNTYAPN